MKIRCCFIFAVVAVLFVNKVRAQTSTPEPPCGSDVYCTKFLDSFIQFFTNSEQRPISSVEMKHFFNGTPSLPQLGDRVSIAALKLYGTPGLLDSNTESLYLVAARNAFTDRKAVRYEADLDPKVTFFVLEFIKEKDSREVTQKRIRYLEQCMKDFTCSSQAEADFVHGSKK